MKYGQNNQTPAAPEKGFWEIAKENGVTKKKIAGVLLSLAAIIFVLVVGDNLAQTVEKGTYDIKQAAVSGTLTAKMTPGMYGQWFGDVTTWPKADTFYFTADLTEGKKIDQSISVQFNDGSKCKISGSVRVITPVTEEKAIALIAKHGYQSYPALELDLILKIVRNSLRRSANLMTARESYAEKRADFTTWTWDQIENGRFQTIEKQVTVKDLTTGQEVTKVIKEIKTDDAGEPIRDPNPLEDLGITLSNFEIKEFVYEPRVVKQITQQQERLMAVATAKAEASKAEQDAKTAEQIGKKKVMEAQYEEEEKRKRAVVQAQARVDVETQSKLEAEIKASKDKEVSLIAATKNKEVVIIQANQQREAAEIGLEEAKLRASAVVATAEGAKTAQVLEAEGRKALLEADNALGDKLKAWIDINQVWAAAYAKRNVPSTIFGASENGAGSQFDASAFMQILTAKAAADLDVDVSVKK